MIEWKIASVKPPANQPLLLWYSGAEAPVIGSAYYYKSREGWGFSSASARGVVWTHWSKINDPEGREVQYV